MSQGVAVFFTTNRASRLFSASRRATGMSERGDFFIRRISTAVSLASVVCFPAFFRAGCRLSVVVFNFVTESIDFCLSSQYLSAL